MGSSGGNSNNNSSSRGSRKAVLFISNSDSEESIAKVRDMLLNAGIEFVEYNIDEEPAGCCGGFRTETPALFAPEGIFRGVEGIARYIQTRMNGSLYSSESAYW
ncbi:MAG: hypothetical protein ACK4FV_05520 [Candidatus Nitrosocaldus sp.]